MTAFIEDACDDVLSTTAVRDGETNLQKPKEDPTTKMQPAKMPPVRFKEKAGSDALSITAFLKGKTNSKVSLQLPPPSSPPSYCTMTAKSPKNSKFDLVKKEAKNVSPLPRCVCGWKNCRTYQKAFRAVGHPTLDGVITMQFVKGEIADILLKSAVDRSLKIPKDVCRAWKGGTKMVKYVIARHHFTEAHIKRYLLLKTGNYQWNSLFTVEQAKEFLFDLDPKNSIRFEGKAYPLCYIQCPSVPKEIVKKQFLLMKAGKSCDLSRTEIRDTLGIKITYPAVESMVEYAEMLERALRNYETVYKMEPGTATRVQVLAAGIEGWALVMDKRTEEEATDEGWALVRAMLSKEEANDDEGTPCFGGYFCKLIHGAVQKITRVKIWKKLPRLTTRGNVDTKHESQKQIGNDNLKDSSSVATDSDTTHGTAGSITFDV